MADALFSESDPMFGGDAGPGPQTKEVQTQPEPAAPEPQSGQPRDEGGRFATKPAEQPVQQQEPAPAQPVASTPSKPQVDPEQFKGYLDEREKRQAAEARAKDLEKQLSERTAKPVEIPSVQTDPAAWEQYQQQLVQQTRTSTIFDVSETMAREKHGDAPVQEAMDWAMGEAQRSPHFAAEYLRQKHPIDWAVKQKKRSDVMGKIGDDPDAWVRARYAELTAAPQTNEPQAPASAPNQPAAPVSQQPQTPAAPPRSLASAPSAGGLNTVVPTGEFAALEDMFGKK